MSVRPPEFYSCGLSGVAADGPNVQLSFAAFEATGAADRTLYVNVRIVMSEAAVDDMLRFLTELKNRAAAPLPPKQ